MKFKVGDKVILKRDVRYKGKITHNGVIVEIDKLRNSFDFKYSTLKVMWIYNDEPYLVNWARPSKLKLDPKILRNDKLIQLGI